MVGTRLKNYHFYIQGKLLEKLLSCKVKLDKYSIDLSGFKVLKVFCKLD